MVATTQKDRPPAPCLPDFGGATGGLLITGNSGLIEGTHVASSLGWRPVETICAGDRVLTFDHGMQMVIDIQREEHEHRLLPPYCPVHVPAGALHNHRDLWLMPAQGMMVECDAVQDILGDPFAVIPAGTLDGFRGIRAVPTESVIQVTTLAFETDQAIYVEGGMLAYCPRPRSLLADDGAAAVPLYNILSCDEARAMVELMLSSDETQGFGCDPDELAYVADRRHDRPVRLTV